MTSLLSAIQTHAYNALYKVSEGYSRFTIKLTDLEIGIETLPEVITIQFKPITQYGKFFFQIVYDRVCEEELKDKERKDTHEMPF